MSRAADAAEAPGMTKERGSCTSSASASMVCSISAVISGVVGWKCVLNVS